MFVAAHDFAASAGGASRVRRSSTLWITGFLRDAAHWCELVPHINGVFESSVRSRTLPTVVVVDDLDDGAEDYRRLLTEVADAGAIVLAAESDAEFEALKQDPRAFAAGQIAVAMKPAAAAATKPPISVPSKPDDYKEFATPFTKISPEDLAEVIEGPRTDAWRYET